MKKNIIVITTTMALAFMAQPAFADIDGHKHSPKKASAERLGHHQHPIHKHSKADVDVSHDDEMSTKSEMFLVKKTIDGFTVSFHVMKAKEGMQHGGSHNLMVKVEKSGKALTDVVINSKVIHPNKTSESKLLMKMGDWFMIGYDLGHEGQHGIMILFKTADGMKHKGSVYYPESK
ncbi:MAG: hypothetical protein R8M38_07730 [Mariprofundaceae bacterium]